MHRKHCFTRFTSRSKNKIADGEEERALQGFCLHALDCSFSPVSQSAPPMCIHTGLSTHPNTSQHNTTQHNITQHNTTQHNTTQLTPTQHNSPQHNSAQHHLCAFTLAFHLTPTQLNSTQHHLCALTLPFHFTSTHTSTQQHHKLTAPRSN